MANYKQYMRELENKYIQFTVTGFIDHSEQNNGKFIQNLVR